jgi:hypothetical protein
MKIWEPSWKLKILIVTRRTTVKTMVILPEWLKTPSFIWIWIWIDLGEGGGLKLFCWTCFIFEFQATYVGLVLSAVHLCWTYMFTVFIYPLHASNIFYIVIYIRYYRFILTTPLLSQHSRSQAWVKEEGCDRVAESSVAGAANQVRIFVQMVHPFCVVFVLPQITLWPSEIDAFLCWYGIISSRY